MLSIGQHGRNTNTGTPNARTAAGTPLPLEDPVRAARAAQLELDEAPASARFAHGRLLQQPRAAELHRSEEQSRPDVISCAN